MYSLIGVEEVIKTIYTLSHPYLQPGQNPSLIDIKLALRKHLSKIQPNVSRSELTEIEFILSGVRIESLLNALMIEREEMDKKTPEQLNQKDSLKKVMVGFDDLCKRANRISDIFRMVIDTIVVTTDVKISGSATISNAVGIMWVQPDNWWSNADILEALVHELTHTLLFLDEQRYGHYSKVESLNDEKTWVPSAIRNELRPINGVVHSIIVAAEILNLRKELHFKQDELNLHGNSRDLIIKTKNSLDAIMQKPASWNLLSKRMQFLLETTNKLMNSLYREIIGEEEYVAKP
ncbi:HEXXH motif-containing putative peptide modification protein [Ectobacillus antri]|uniref:HEXXH motif-containing putative peptide modification protein n=1 Tax=Ectobacillus antri TaxID=2486280 RepID=A0ABT6HA31_9BACI|nr:HEXXH motif-containing putative peptide modification protein [Ectobacillus antri]MDG4658580.1 HEXXH motif-containing putative peptide modification protein [Ectobacillus antri]MDG5755584.1 HEXXH motif-containing putative peptide modification protein [Ectobacillus antri]